MTRTYLQTVFSSLNCAPQKTRAELLGLVQGVLADGVIVESEAAYLQRWIEEHASIQNTWPASALYARIGVMLSDGVLDQDEQRELLGTLVQFAEFAALPRKKVEATITQLGGTVIGAVSKKVHYVVVGSLGNELWKGGNYGTKIERAIELRREGVAVRVVSEKHWLSASTHT